MTMIIPAIIPQSFQDLEEKIKKVKPFFDWIQLDIMDGKFVENATWNNPRELADLRAALKSEGCPQINFEAHLMAINPEKAIGDWIGAGVKRIIFHYEATDKHREIIKRIKENNLEAGIAVNPETDIKAIDDFIDCLDLVLVMTVNPGKAGQKFIEETLVKVRGLRDKCKNVKIEVDGGINLETAPKAIKAGADILAVGSGIFKGNIEENIKLLKDAV